MANMIEQSLLCKVLDAPDLEILHSNGVVEEMFLRDESYLKELIEANKGLINILVSPYLTSIPNSELEDLTSESYIPMLRAIEDYDPEQGVGGKQ